MKRMIFGSIMLFCGSVGVMITTICGVMLVISKGTINGREDFFHHLSLFGFRPIFNGFLLMAVVGLVLCFIEYIIDFTSNKNNSDK